jgi:hypothetical protein
VSIEFGTDTTYGKSTWVQNTPPGGGAVQILVAGMLANTTYHMRADVSFPDGTQFFDADHTFATGGLPAARVPQITVTNPSGLTPSPGITLLNLQPGASNQVQIAAVDNAGNLIWYYDFSSYFPAGTYVYVIPAKLTANGHLMAIVGQATLVNPLGYFLEVDLAGNLIYEFTRADFNNWLSAAGYNLAAFEVLQDFVPLPNGHMIFIFNYIINCTDIAGCVGTGNVWANALVDLDANHKPVWVWNSLDHLCSSTSTGPCLDINRRPWGLPDWTHANSLTYSPDDGNLLMSMRGQCWVLKIDYQDGQGSGDILWRLGAQGDFTLKNANGTVDENIDDWFYSQHYAYIMSPNSTGVFNLIVFDNGDYRGLFDVPSATCGTAGAPACYSTVPLLQVDEVNMTATILWRDNLSPVYSDLAGNAQLLNDMVAIGIAYPSDDPTGSRYMEVTHDPSPQVVLRMEVSGQNAYRLINIPSLYPGVQW